MMRNRPATERTTVRHEVGTIASWVDGLIVLVGLGSGSYLISQALPYRGAPAGTLGAYASLGIALGMSGLVVAVWHARRKGWSLLARLPLAVAPLLTGLLAGYLAWGWRAAKREWPPHAGESRAGQPSTIPDSMQASWGAHVMAHLIGSPSWQGQWPVVPDEWPFPRDLGFALDSSPAAYSIWARTPGGVIACVDLPMALAPLDPAQRCELRKREAGGYRFVPTRRGEVPAETATTSVAPGSWTQYRGQADRAGMAETPRTPTVTGWRTSTPGPIRASVSVVGRTVLVGGHGTGSILALDLGDGHLLWRARAPSWIHQDPVSDGRVVVVGFGDNESSFTGQVPSGIAAYDLRTGTRLWTVFDESSVMTSAVLRDGLVIYATAAGVLRKRELDTGTIVDSLQLPGGVIMAPLALVGDTLVATLDHAGVCAIRASDLARLWCREFPHLRMMGHASPAVRDGRVVVSGQSFLFGLTLGDYRRLGRGLQRRLISRSLVPPGDKSEVAGQTFLALSLHTGETIWSEPTFGYREAVKGHISGTAVLGDSVGVIVLPFADTLVAFSPQTGQMRWSSGSHRARGAPLVLDAQVVVAGRDGITELRDLHTGALRCRMVRETGYDRGGPTVAGGLVIFADLKGMVEAIPAAQLTACTAEGATPAPR